MNSTDIVVKTAKGAEQVAAHTRTLPQRLRTMLILIDGSLTAGKLQEAAANLGAPADFLDILQQEGFIAVSSTAVGGDAGASEADRFRAAQKFMNDTVVDALGFRAFFFTLKMEKCFTRAELAGLLDDYAKAIAKGGGEKVAGVLEARARELLA